MRIGSLGTSILDAMFQPFRRPQRKATHPAHDDVDVLVVIDMQPYFKTSQDQRTLRAVEREIKGAIEHREPVLYVNYTGCGPTDKRLTDLTSEYPNKYAITKTGDDGSREIDTFLRQHDIDKPHLRICGVNTGACVHSTVQGLSEALAEPCQIDVLGHACNTKTDNARQLENIRAEHLAHVRVFAEDEEEAAKPPPRNPHT